VKESDLYAPIKKLLESLNFTAKGEIKNCDIAAIRDDELWIVELKRHMSVDLIYQAIARQAISPFVFVAIPRPKRVNRQMLKLLKKLELGLITVAMDSPIVRAEIALFPTVSKVKYGKRASVLRKEIKGRVGDTPGGSTGIPITTAYKERCIKIACFLSQVENLSPKELRQHGCEQDAGSILQKNHYGWFARISRGRYELTENGHDFLKNNANSPIISHYIEHAKIVLSD